MKAKKKMSCYSIFYQLATRAYLKLQLVRIRQNLGTIRLIHSYTAKCPLKWFTLYINGLWNRWCEEFQGPHLQLVNNLCQVYWLSRLWLLTSCDFDSLKQSFVDRKSLTWQHILQRFILWDFWIKHTVISTNVILLVI